jgi:hypothetical protein
LVLLPAYPQGELSGFAPNATPIALALLSSLALGVAAMFTSAVQLSILNSSFRQILLLKEVRINGHAIEHIQKHVSSGVPLGFIYGQAKAHKLLMYELVGVKNAWDALGILLFGPGYFLLPTVSDETRVSAGSDFEITAHVRGESVFSRLKATIRMLTTKIVGRWNR